jgi:mannose-1-phosphate guanylyltransferase
MAAGLKALLAAAGTGTRLRPLTDVLPKCLMPINGKPLLGIWFDLLSDADVSEIVVNLHHHAALVREYVARSPHAGMVTLAHEEALLGTAGTLMHHRERLSGGMIFFAHADNLAAFDMARFLDAHRARPRGTVMTMMTFVTDTPALCGIVRLDERGRIDEFHEKSPQANGNVANAAVYLLEPEIFALIDTLGSPVVDFSTDVLVKVLDRVHTFHNDVYHRDIGTPASLAQAQRDYFKAAGVAVGNSKADDPWYGLMSDNGGALARDFARAVEAAGAEVNP